MCFPADPYRRVPSVALASPPEEGFGQPVSTLLWGRGPKLAL